MDDTVAGRASCLQTKPLPERGHEQPRFLLAFGVAVAMTALFAAWLGWGLGGETTVRYVDDLATMLAALAAAALCVRAGLRQEGRLRAFWWLLAGACGAWTLGELIWALYDLVLLGEVPVPSWADAAYLTAIPLAAAALVSHPGMRGSRTGKARSLLDGLVIATALLFLSWTLVLDPLWRASDLTTLGGLVTLAYPFGDVVVVFFIVLLVHGMTRGARVDLWCLLAGLLAITLSDTAYGYLTEVKDYATGNLIDTGWVAGYLAIAVGAFCSKPETTTNRAAESPSLTPAAVLTPFLPMLAALTVAAIQIELGHRLDRAAWSMALVLVGLVLVRQALLVVDLLAPGREREASVSDRLVSAVGGAIPGPARAEPSPTPGGES
jgi:hypothetical protein